jgi:signal transduction histidine kinase
LSRAPILTRDTVRRQFFRTFLHDLATPLSAVSLHLEGAIRRLARGDNPAESLDVARMELGRVFELFEDGRELLLSEPRDAENFAFDEWVEATVRAVGGNGIGVEGRTGGRIEGDREKLAEALSSLLVNALEHASSAPVRVFRERGGNRLQVRIENVGRLPGDDPEKLFAPRAAGAGKKWGMGLARARLFAADAGGSVQLCQNGDRVSAILTLPEEPV